MNLWITFVSTCHATSQVTVPMWENRKVLLPYPVEPALAAIYGANWRLDLSTPWRTAIDPFMIGYCNPWGADGLKPDFREDKHGNAFIEAPHGR